MTGDRPDGDVLTRALECLDSGQDAALVTLLDVTGNAYRRPGARRLVVPDGADAGTITPGCLDASIARTVERVLETGEPTTVTVDLEGEDGTWGPGTGCDGVVDVLVEPVGESLRRPLAAHADGEPAEILTVIESDVTAVAVGDRARTDAGIEPLRGDWPAWLCDPLRTALEGSEAPETVTVSAPDGVVTVFLDRFVPPPRLVVFGTGADVGPIVDAARLAGFRPSVVGFRGARTRPDRFPGAAAVHSARPDSVTDTLDVDADTVAVVATHNFVDDRLTIEGLLESPAPYIGVVGSRDRFERLIETIETEPSSADLDRLYGPAGLDLGAESPHQVALAIVSEALAVSTGHSPRHLRERPGPIHDRE